MKSKYQKDWDRGESFVFVGRGFHKELVPVKYVVARNKVTKKTTSLLSNVYLFIGFQKDAFLSAISRWQICCC